MKMMYCFYALLLLRVSFGNLEPLMDESLVNEPLMDESFFNEPLIDQSSLEIENSTQPWKWCARENGRCKCHGNVIYGSGKSKTNWKFKKIHGSIDCSNNKFGDPHRGVVKNCYCQGYKRSGLWYQCASENKGSCKCNGAVLYGSKIDSNKSVIIKVHNGSVPCTNGKFGDPHRGTYKHCYCKWTPKPIWRKCASENRGTCKCVGDVLYGSNVSSPRSVITRVVGSTPCTNQVFGDPHRGTYKHCFCRQVLKPSWHRCASEHSKGSKGRCKCVGDVLYGASLGSKRRFIRRVNGSAACANNFFGDPHKGTRKHCFCKRNWYRCASERRGLCKCRGQVLYGASIASRKSVIKNVNGSINCHNNKFGDPHKGTYKHCFCKQFPFADCPKGYYCPAWSTKRIACPAGSYCPVYSSKSKPCPAGSYCPAGSSKWQPCPAGYYCPAKSSNFTRCKGGNFCPAKSSRMKPCKGGTYCPAGSSNATRCKGGNFCPAKSSQMKLCKAGTFCPAGSSRPQICPKHKYCPKGSRYPKSHRNYVHKKDGSRWIRYEKMFNKGKLQKSKCDSWKNWQRGNFKFLNRSKFTSVKFESISKGKNNLNQFVCNNDQIATDICRAMKSKQRPGKNVLWKSWKCNGYTWRIGNCGVSGVDSIEVSVGEKICRCYPGGSDGASIRPCINNVNWGGVRGKTCGSNTEKVSLSCELPKKWVNQHS